MKKYEAYHVALTYFQWLPDFHIRLYVFPEALSRQSRYAARWFVPKARKTADSELCAG